MADKKVYKDEKGHFTNKENDGGPCHHDGAGSGDYKSPRVEAREKELQETAKGPHWGRDNDGNYYLQDKEGKKINYQSREEAESAYNKMMNDLFDDDYDEEFEDGKDKLMKGSIYYTGDNAYKITEVNDEEVEFIDKDEKTYIVPIQEFRDMVESDEFDTTGLTREEAEDLGIDFDTWGDEEGQEIHKSAAEQDEAMRARLKTGDVHEQTYMDARKSGKSPEEADKIANDAIKPPYKAKYANEDFEDARFYPVTDEDRKNAGPRYKGRYHSIADAHGLTDNDTWDNEHRMFKYAGDSKTGASIVQGPDGYYSGNPRINSMSFKTFEQARDYLDGKNPEDHKYGTYYEGDVQKTYRGKDDNGKEYDLEAPDVYKAARTKKSDLTNKIKDQIDDGVTEDDIGYLRQVLNETGINQLTNDQIRKIISSIRSRK